MTTRRLSAAAMIAGCLILTAVWTEVGGETRASAAQVGRQGTSLVVHPDRIRQVIARYLDQRVDRRAQDLQVTLLDPKEPVTVPPGNLEFNVQPGAVEEHLGRQIVRVHVLVDGREVGVVEALVEIAAYADAVVAQRLIKPGELIEPEDVTITRIKLVDLHRQFVSELGDVIGKSVVRPIPAHSPVRPSQIKPADVVRKGDRVTIEAQGGGLSIRVAGVSKSGGRVGEYVAVTNVDSGKEIRARVVAPGVVRVDY